MYYSNNCSLRFYADLSLFSLLHSLDSMTLPLSSDHSDSSDVGYPINSSIRTNPNFSEISEVAYRISDFDSHSTVYWS